AADLGRIPLVAVLVVPLPCLQPALDVDLLALDQILVERLSRLPPENYAVPLGLLLLLTPLVVPDFRRCEIECRDRRAARRISQLRISAEIADEDHFFHAAIA